MNSTHLVIRTTGNCMPQDNFIIPTNSGKPEDIAGYGLDGTPITKSDLLLSIRKAEEDYAKGHYYTHEEVLQAMNDFITRVSNEQV